MVECLSEHLAVLESIRAAYAELSGATSPLDDQAVRVFDDMLASGEESGKSHGARHDMPLSKTTDFLLARRADENASLARVVLPQSLVVAMVSQHDAFTGRLIRTLYDLKPELLAKIKRPLGVADLNGLRDIGEVRAKLIDDEIGSVLRESHAKQLAWLAALLDMRLDSDPQMLARFREVTQRRNLYAHSAGVINTHYLQARKAIDPRFVGRVGTKLDLSADDFESAFAVLVEIAVKLWQVTWRKTRPDEVPLAEEALYRLNYTLLVFDDLPLAERLLQFALAMPQTALDQTRRKNVVNLAQAYKWQGDEALCRDTLRGDWTACEDSFALAIAVLEDDYDEAERLMLAVGAAGHIVEQAFRDWPLFREFRTTPQFKRAYDALFTPAAPDRVA